MKRKIVGMLICTLLISTALPSIATNQSQTNDCLYPPIEWSRLYGGGDSDYLKNMQMTSDGGYIMVGLTYVSGREYVYLVKANADGYEEWSKTKGTSDTAEIGFCVQQTNDGGYIIAGEKLFFNDPGLEMEGYWIKTDANGVTAVETTGPGSSGWDECHCVQQTTDGGYISVGDTTSYDPAEQVWVVKKNAYLVTEWSKHFGSQSSGSWIECTSDGGYILTGYTISPTHAHQMLLSKLDANGNEEWFKTFGGTEIEMGWCVKQTSDGGYIVVGDTNSYGMGYCDVFVVKTDANGNQQWDQTIGTPENELGCSIAETYNGGFFIVGAREVAYTYDVHVAQLDAVGNIEWANIYGDTSNVDDGRSGYQTADGGYIVAGTTTSSGNCDFWLFKLETENTAPDKPTLTGDENGKPGTDYTYTMSTIDPDGDEVYYHIDWDDGNESNIGPFNSGVSQTAHHTWSTKGTYVIEVYAYDVFNAQSEVTTLSVSIPTSTAIFTLHPVLIWLFERFPNAFPLLRHIMRY